VLVTSVGLADVEAARQRIAPHVRRTPLMEARPTLTPALADGSLYLKLECLQVTGSFKARGAVNMLLGLPPEVRKRGVVTASGGNHGLGVAYAGWLTGVPATIYLPTNTPPAKAHKLEQWGAHVIIEGAVWDDANRAALALADERGLTYVHPFADAAVIAGQGTIMLDILDELATLDVLVVAIGGGGLIGGMALTAKTLKPQVRVVGVEPVGAATLYESVRAGHLVELPAITTAANTLAPRMSASLNLGLVQRYVDEIVLVTDEAMREAAQWLWFEMGVAAELSGAATTAAVRTGQVAVGPGQCVCAVVSGAGTDGQGI
jgi:threonine dehydratase